jgi:glycosyltransferase involved in cell wall biosynthesis
MKKNLLFIGWFDIPHSYAIVNCNQIISLIKKYSNIYNFFRLDYPYPDIYKNQWGQLDKKEIYSKESYNYLNQLKKWQGEKIDLVYSITYPYDVNMIFPNVPKVVFFTAEFAEINASYFNLNVKILDDTILSNYLESNKYIHFTSPSPWSKDSLLKYGRTNEIISHGIDPEIFKINHDKRNSIRNMYKIKESDVVFLNLGSMTGNKGVLEMFIALTICICRLKMTHLKLILKGINDLYQSENFVINYINETIKQNILKKEEVDYVLDNNVIFINKTLNFQNLSDIYNACDVYVSPYKAEGFNLTALESLACGMDIIISDNGSTKFFVDDILNISKEGVHILPTQITTQSDNTKCLQYNINDIINIINKKYNTSTPKSNWDNKKKRVEYIHNNYSWDNTSDKLYSFFQSIIN